MLFSNKLDFKVLHERTDHEGRYIICKLEVNEEIFWCLNIYAPNTLKEKKFFFEKLYQVLDELEICETD